MIAIVDTGGANLASIGNALTRLGETWQLTVDPAAISAASHLILPGVGAAADSMSRLQQRKLVPLLRSISQPMLGICLGMQLFFNRSEEGEVGCLGLLDGTVSRMQPGEGVRIPHIGWNRVVARNATPLLAGIEQGSHFYFVHSFRAPEGPWVVAESEHGQRLPAIIQHNNLFGCQFHPERSGEQGARLLRNFLNL